MAAVSVDAARTILGDDVLGPADAAKAFAVTANAQDTQIPFTEKELQAARDAGEMLVWRAVTASAAPLTLLRMIELHPDAFDRRFLRTMGYQLKDEWGIELEPGAGSETCEPGWHLVPKLPLPGSCNLAYEQQDELLAAYAQKIGVPRARLRRRRATEIAYDTLLYFCIRQVRLLDRSWDWSSTQTVDGGYLNIGGFGPQGMQIFSYSRAVRHGALGLCPNRGAAA